MLTNKSRLKPLLRHGKRGMRLCLASMLLLVMLTGCASNPTPPAVDCPQPPQVPVTLKESSLPAVQTYSKEAQAWFDEVSTFLSGLR